MKSDGYQPVKMLNLLNIIFVLECCKIPSGKINHWNKLSILHDKKTIKFADVFHRAIISAIFRTKNELHLSFHSLIFNKEELNSNNRNL